MRTVLVVLVVQLALSALALGQKTRSAKATARSYDNIIRRELRPFVETLQAQGMLLGGEQRRLHQIYRRLVRKFKQHPSYDGWSISMERLGRSATFEDVLSRSRGLGHAAGEVSLFLEPRDLVRWFGPRPDQRRAR